MNIDDIVSRVRWAIDEEALTNESFLNASAGDSTKMDNIIKASIGTALHWVCLHAPVEMLTGNDGTTPPPSEQQKLIVDKELTVGTGTGHYTVITIGTPPTTIGCTFGVENDFLRLIRVRGDSWYRAVMSPFSEDSDEYLQLRDENGAMATNDRPQAALILSATKQIEAYPAPAAKIVYTYVKDPLAGGATDYTSGTATAPFVPAKAQAALIYYIAFLVLSAYGDARAARMLEIAMMNIGQKP